MHTYEVNGKKPQIADGAFVAPTAVLIGDVRISAGASVWFGAVLRADYEPIRVLERANIQDNCVLHTAPGFPVTVERDVTVGHLCMIHGAHLHEGALIGNGATVLDGSSVGAGALVAAHALVRQGAEIRSGTIVAGVPAKELGSVDGDVRGLVENNASEYAKLSEAYLDTFRLVKSPSITDLDASSPDSDDN